MIITTSPLPDADWQYWYTMDVPMDGGVYPVEVYAPRLVAYQPVHIVELGAPPVAPQVPEPGTWIVFAIGILIGLVAWVWEEKRKRARRVVILDAVRKLEPNASTLEIGRLVQGKVSFGAIYVELAAMEQEGILDSRVEVGGFERGGMVRVFYSIKKGLEESKSTP